MEVGSAHSTAALGSCLELSSLEPLNRWHPLAFLVSGEPGNHGAVYDTAGAVR